VLMYPPPDDPHDQFLLLLPATHTCFNGQSLVTKKILIAAKYFDVTSLQVFPLPPLLLMDDCEELHSDVTLSSFSLSAGGLFCSTTQTITGFSPCAQFPSKNVEVGPSGGPRKLPL